MGFYILTLVARLKLPVYESKGITTDAVQRNSQFHILFASADDKKPTDEPYQKHQCPSCSYIYDEEKVSANVQHDSLYLSHYSFFDNWISYASIFSFVDEIMSRIRHCDSG